MLNIVIPLGGKGQRFQDRGYTFPKPLIEIAGRPMVEIVLHSLTPSEPHRFVFVCRQEHLDRYALGDVLRLLAPSCVILPMRSETGGALCSVLLGRDVVDPECELVVANGDQYTSVGIDELLQHARAVGDDGCLMVFPSTHPKWSYARTNDAGLVEIVAEKRPISRNATVGVYYFRRGLDFIEGAERMMLKGTRTSGEFYLAPVYNELILDGKRVGIFPITRVQMHSLGTPEDVEAFSKVVRDLPAFKEEVSNG